ncbi:MAG: HAD-IC family P-type ATPase, partial [Gemmatimonadaceae bacterium]|nr:HAD-IC family P-type ATPase [Chitinophagaceae bacterium]
MEEMLHHAMMLNNEVRFSDDGALLGDSTETAMVKYSIDMGLSKENAEKKFPAHAELPFDSDRMRMSTFHQHEDQWILFVKGAPAKVVEVLSAEEAGSSKTWLYENKKWAGEGLRVLLFGYKMFDKKPEHINEHIEKDLKILGMVAMIDPPREEVVKAIRDCSTAGIKTMMITGDQPLTAAAIANRLQMVENGEASVMSGAEIEKLSDQEFTEKISSVQVFARVSPSQKLRIVQSLQSNGQFVAMTGDGVNDAPSLKQADIGVAMGITGSDVSKEAADMILLDDNFATIIKAIREGRRIYENIRKFIIYVLSCNLAEILTIFFAPIFGLPVPLLPIHILWINLVTDGLPGLALTAEPAEKGIMSQPPRSPKENLFAGGLITRVVANGILMAVAVILTQFWAAENGYSVVQQQTIVFTLLCFVQLGNALSVRSSLQSIFNKAFFTNWFLWLAIGITILLQLLIVYIEPLEKIFKVEMLDAPAMEVIVGVTLASVLAFEAIKLLSRKKIN